MTRDVVAHHQKLHHTLSGVFPARFEPPLKGISEQSGPFIERTDISPGKSFSYRPSEDFFDRAKDSVITSDQVRPLLLGKSYGVVNLEFVRSPAESKQEPALVHMTIYNYTDDITLDIHFNFHDLCITSVKQAQYQPPLNAQELDHAISIAMGDKKIAAWLTSEVRATGIQVTNQGPDPKRQHRQVLVLFGAVDDTSARYWALVDLSNSTVREVGKVTEKVGGMHHG